MLFQRHYNNAELLAWFDGEAPRLVGVAIEKHLRSCWRCRTQVWKLEQQIRTASEQYDGESCPPTGVDHRRRFLQGIAQYERDVVPALRAPSARIEWLPFAIAAALVALIGGPLLSHRPEPAVVLSAAEIAARSGRAEAPPPRQTLYQVFTVSLRQSHPAARDRQAELQVWSDPAAGRFCSRLEDSAGHLRLGIWKDAARSYVYRANAPATGGGRPDRFESAFLHWLESREWQPILLGSETAIYRTAQGEWVRTQRASAGDGTVVLAAERTVEDVRIMVAVEFDTRTWRARVQRIRMTCVEATAEIQLTAVRREVLDPAQVREVVFRPDHGLLPSGSPPRLEPATALPEAQPDDRLDDRETEILYALHRVHADLGEPVTVRQDAGRIRVEGLFHSAERREQVAAALAELTDGPAPQLQLRSVDEMAALPATAVQPAMEPGGTESRSESALHAMLRQQWQKAANERSVELGNAAVRISSETMEAAWALRRLSDRYPAARIPGLRPRSRWLVEAITRDLTELLQADAAELGRVLEPTLRPLAGTQELPLEDRPASMFESVVRLRDLVHYTFADRRLEPGDEQQFATPRNLAREILLRCAGLRERIKLAGDTPR